MNKLANLFAAIIFSVLLPMRLTAEPLSDAAQSISALGQAQQEVC